MQNETISHGTHLLPALRIAHQAAPKQNKKIKMQTHRISLTIILLTTTYFLSAQDISSRVVGHYTYEHGWSYTTKEGHFTAHETGTMDFYPDGTALDSAQQNYVVDAGGKMHFLFNYISPSRWRVEGEDFYFAGIEESFRMEVLDMETVEPDRATVLANSIIGNARGGIAREVKFHLDKLTDRELVWSYTYPDGHTDTWEFYRVETGESSLPK